MNKALQLEKEWRRNTWRKRTFPIKNPKEKWTTKIRLIITLQEHQINEAITADIETISNIQKVERILIITLIPQYDIWPQLRI